MLLTEPVLCDRISHAFARHLHGDWHPLLYEVSEMSSVVPECITRRWFGKREREAVAT